MNLPSYLQFIEDSFHLFLGTTKAFADMAQNPQQISSSLNRIQQHPEQMFCDLKNQGKDVFEEANKFFGSCFAQPNKPSKKPEYIERSDEQCFLQPYDIKGTNLYGFVLEGSLHKLQQICDRYLNQPAQGNVEYRALTHYVFLTFGTMDSLSSINQPDSQKGYVLEQEVVFWILTAVGKRKGPVFVVDRLAWFMPYVFVNNSPVLVSGREVYGISKQLGSLTIPHPNEEPNLFSLDTLTWKTFSPQTQAIDSRLLEVHRIQSGRNHPALKNWNTPQEVQTEIVNLLFGDSGLIDIPSLELPFHLLEYLSHTAVPVVFLKQFRDAENGRQACYQAIIENLMTMYRFHQGKLLGFDEAGDQFELLIYDCASHPIVSDLGLAANCSPGDTVTRLPIKLSFWVNFDFTVDNGKVIYQAS